jgi:5-hydroxyisourate hydrolase
MGVIMRRLTTHVLDTAAGKPAAGVNVELYRVGDDNHQHVTAATTNADGRVDAPLIEGEDFTPGTYELRFHAGDYLRRHGGHMIEPAFLDVIPIRFSVSAPVEDYHVPLLLSPFGYSTYRGS